MSRIHQFRAWNRKTKTFSYWTLDQMFRTKAVTDDEFNDNDWSESTGLKDKNGKEIYENDIVKGNPIGSTGFRLGQVIWMNDGWYVSDETERDLEKRLHGDFFSKVEVLGNIYEDAKLLGYED